MCRNYHKFMNVVVHTRKLIKTILYLKMGPKPFIITKYDLTIISNFTKGKMSLNKSQNDWISWIFIFFFLTFHSEILNSRSEVRKSLFFYSSIIEKIFTFHKVHKCLQLEQYFVFLLGQNFLIDLIYLCVLLQLLVHVGHSDFYSRQ